MVPWGGILVHTAGPGSLSIGYEKEDETPLYQGGATILI